MLAAGTASSLVAVESATKGLAVFRMPRDDAFCSDTLRLLARFAAAFGPGPSSRPVPPGSAVDLFAHHGGTGAAHSAWLRRCSLLAASASLVDYIAEPVRPQGGRGPFL